MLLLSNTYFEISQMENAEGKTVSKYSRSMVSQRKSYQTTDPNISAKNMQDLLKNGILYPESNGLVERTIQTVKHTLKKAFKDEEDPYLALLALRAAPRPNFSCQYLVFESTKNFNSISRYSHYPVAAKEVQDGQTIKFENCCRKMFTVTFLQQKRKGKFHVLSANFKLEL